MPYVVFALRWRPNNFDEVVGQNNIVATLKNAIQQNRLAHAYLFAGPRGVGKTSTARILAKALNCKNGPTLRPCGGCSACMEIAQGRSLDVIEIDAASNTGVDNIRDLRESVKFAPVSGKYKIYIVDEVHMLSNSAFNALLKTLEEPPPYVKFIFATTHPHDVIPTVLSRCQRLDFRRISTLEIITQLEKIATAEKINIDQKVLFAIAKSSDGSLRDAESVLDQLISFSKGKVSLEDVVSMLGLVQQDAFFDITDKIIEKDTCGALELMNRIIDEGKDMGNFLTNLIEHFRNLMIARITQADPRLIDLPKEICERLLQQAQVFSLEEIFNAFNILVNTQEMAKRLESLRIPLEISLVKLTHDKKGHQSNPSPSKHAKDPDPQPPEEKALPQAAKKEEDTPEPETSDPPAPIQSVVLDNVKSAWNHIIDNLGRIKMSVATYLNEGAPTKLEKNILTVSFPMNHSLHKEALERKENKAIIEKIFSELLNVNIRINFTLSKDVAQKNSHDADPFLRSALETFNGRVIKEE